LQIRARYRIKEIVQFLGRLLGRPPKSKAQIQVISAIRTLGGREVLEVVGESHYQDHLWRIAGGFTAQPVRNPIRALLIPEPDNPYDPNAIRVVVDNGTVGYLSREDAVAYGPGLHELMDSSGATIALEGQLVGGGPRGNGIGMLGVFLDHNPVDFGVRPQVATHIGQLRTGLGEAVATDLEDDSYDLSWLSRLSGSRTSGDIATLRKLLEAERDPIDRHYMFVELSACLYKGRDAFASALDEFDAVCEGHHAEMATIRPALHAKFGCIPVIEMYRQAAIRCQKARDWQGMRSWTTRGLDVYGDHAARPEAVADLEKRLAYALAKLAGPATQQARHQPDATEGGELESLVCSNCGELFERARTRGRKPHHCPACRELVTPRTTS
jgi:hypothetical protein